MITEKATNWWDLPHTYKADRNMPDSECRCGREKAHELHDEPISLTEKAASEPQIVTEKGI